MSETKEEVRYVMLYEWRKGNNAHNTTKIITQIFGDVVCPTQQSIDGSDDSSRETLSLRIGPVVADQ